VLILSSAEDEFVERVEQHEINAKRQSSAALALDKLTEVQRRRYVMYHAQGMTECEIADEEGSTQQAISKSLAWAEKKIKNFG